MHDKLLIVDDSESERKAIRHALKDLFSSFIEAEDGLSAIKAFVEERPGFVITDIEMPAVNGYRFMTSLRGIEDGRDVPVIMLSGKNDSLEKKLIGFNLGASDYLTKPFDPAELVARVKSLLRARNLMQELKEKNQLLERLAVTDELTGIFNRRQFFESFRQQLELGLRHNFKIACLIMDIDHFKRINDTWGHGAGDEVLRKIGRLLSACKRGGELLARLGGEEFVICLFNTDSHSALLAAERFRNLIKSYDFSNPRHPGLKHVTTSVGLAIYPRDAIVTVDDLLRAADEALYKSKTDGRDRTTLYEWSPQQAANASGK